LITFIQKEVGKEDAICVSIDEDTDIHTTIRTFVSFLKAITYSNSTIYHGLLQATLELEESLEVDYKTFKNEVLLDS